MKWLPPKEELTSDLVADSPGVKQPNILWAWRPPATRAGRAKGSGHPATEFLKFPFEMYDLLLLYYDNIFTYDDIGSR